MNKDFLVLAFYQFCTIEYPKQAVKAWQRFLGERNAMGRIYISEDGVNAQMSIHESDFAVFETWLREDFRFQKTEIKIHRAHEHVFPKMTVKYREQLAALDRKVDIAETAEHVSPKKWKEMLSSKDENTLLLDVRNDYEYDVGHFEGALRPEMNTFREFPAFAEKLRREYDPKKTKVMMCCTGGIRCELFSPLMKELGFEQVYQLDGGIIKYGLEEGHAHWKGKLFVFDDRLVVPIDDGNDEVISHCKECGASADTLYNCANMDCNDLFISCFTCAEKMHGCCSSACMSAPRVRPYVANPKLVKPFRKLSHEEKQRFNQRA